MAEIRKRYSFEASHILPGHKGKCARLHGHTYHLEVVLQGPIRSEDLHASDYGFVADFGDVSDIVKPMIAHYLDHYHLNWTLEVPRTTAEYIACWIYGHLRARMSANPEKWGNVTLSQVRVDETETSSAVVTDSAWRVNDCLGYEQVHYVNQQADESPVALWK